MATNKFASMLHRNTPKLIVILVYVVLEWILIILLLLNSLLSDLINKYANYFGLKPPCPLCTPRIQRVLEQGKSSNNSYTDVVCESHATQISNMFRRPCSEPSCGSLEYAGKGNSAVEDRIFAVLASEALQWKIVKGLDQYCHVRKMMQMKITKEVLLTLCGQILTARNLSINLPMLVLLAFSVALKKITLLKSFPYLPRMV